MSSPPNVQVQAEPEAGPQDEAQRIFDLVRGDPYRAYEVLERQFNVLVLRAQVMLSLSGIVITVTGFSGRAIAQSGLLARMLISIGLCVVLSAAAVAIWGVLRLRWLTQDLSPDPLQMLRNAIALRHRKSRFLAVALTLFVLGFACYCGSVVLLLLPAPPAAH